MEQDKTERPDKENVEINDKDAFKTLNEDSKLDSSKRSSSIDITIKVEKSLDNGIVMYSSKQLSEIRESIVSTQWPDFLDEGFKNARGQWDPDRWHQNRKRGSTPPPGEGDKMADRRERDGAYASHSASERNFSKPLGMQDRPSALSGDLSRKKLADPKERLKAETEGIVLSPQRRSFNTGCQVTQNTSKEEDLEKNSHDKPNRQSERDAEGMNRERNRDLREGHRGERNAYDRGMDKDDMPLSFRGEGRRRDGVNEYEDRGRRVGSGRIPMNRMDRDRGLGTEEYGTDRTRNDRPRDTTERNNYDTRDRGITERRGLPTIERRDIGREDERDHLGTRSRFNFQRDRDMEESREPRYNRRELEASDEFNRNRGRDWSDSKFKEYDQKRDRAPVNQQNYPNVDRDLRIERRDDRNNESDRGVNRYKPGFPSEDNKFHYGNDSHYNQKYPNTNYGRNFRAGSRYPRRSETEEPEWMSESVQMGELMELRGFDDSPEKENQQTKEKVETNTNDSVPKSVNKDAWKEMKHYDFEAIDMDTLLHLDSIHGLSNILADDSIDHTSSRRMQMKETSHDSANVPPIYDEEIPVTLEQLRANKSAKSVEELEADIKQMVGISGQLNNSSDNKNDEALIPDTHGPMTQFTNKPTNVANNNTNTQGQTEDMSAFKKFAALMEGQGTEKDDPNIQLHDTNYGMESNQMFDNINQEKLQSSIGSNHDYEQLQQTPEIELQEINKCNYVEQPHPIFPQQYSISSSNINFHGQQLHTSHSTLPLQQSMQNLPNTNQTRFSSIDSRNMTLHLQKLIFYTPSSPHLLEYSESITLLNALNSGHVDISEVIHQFIHGNLPPIRREILLNVLKVAQNQGRLGPIPPGRVSPPNFHNLPQYAMSGNTNQPSNSHLNIHSSSNQPDRISPSLAHSPVADPIQMLMQQGKNNSSQRVSPMLLGIGTQAGGKNTLSVSPVPSQQRVPSPQELVIHTQQIMQNALIKRKLEEQKENYRRRNDYQGSGSFRDRSNSDSKSANNPCGDSPLAFTPMSVMKKMAADRRDSDPKAMGNIPELKLSQVTSDVPDSQVGPVGDVRKLPTHGFGISDETNCSNKNVEQCEDPQQRFSGFQEGRESHQLSSSPSSGAASGNGPQMSQPVTSPGQLNQMHLQHAAAIQRVQQMQNQWAMNSGNNTRPPPWNMNPLEHHLLMQQHQFGGPLPPNLVGPVPAVGSQFPPNQANQPFAGLNQQQLPLPLPNANSRPQQIGLPSMNAQSTSPSYVAAPGNLAKFFSPEVLAQAQSGNAPSMPPLPTQKALTLEEIEHQAATLRI